MNLKLSFLDGLTIKQMLIITAIVGILAVAVLAGAGLVSNTSLSSNQDWLMKTISFDEASRGVGSVISDFVVRQSKILSSGANAEIDAFKDRGMLEESYEKQKKKLAGLIKEVPQADDVLARLDAAFIEYMDIDAQILNVKGELLASKALLDGKGALIDEAVQDIMSKAEAVAGKVKFNVKKTERQIKKALDKSDDSQIKGLVTELIAGDLSETQQASYDIRTGVAMLANFSRQIMLGRNPDVLTSLKDNKIVQTSGLVKSSLESLKKSVGNSSELLSLTKDLDRGYTHLISEMIDGNQSAYGLRKAMIESESQLDGLTAGSKASADKVMAELSGLSKLAGSIRVSSTEKSGMVVSRNRYTVIAVGTVTLSVLLILMAGIIRSITKPLSDAVSVSNRLADGDLTVEVKTDRKDEIGMLLMAMRNMVDRLKELLGMVADAGMKIKTSATEISATVEEEMAVSTEQAAAITEITSTMEELSSSYKQIADISGSVLEIANSTLQDSTNGANAVETLMGKMTEINDDNQNSIKEILDLGRKSQEITKVMEIINNIADQTKLIAFNAAIEASGAGEAGKRFGVVAVEIRRLADSVMESTGDINSKISEIQNATNRLVVSSEKGSKRIHEALEFANETVDMLFKIVSGARTTTDSAKQISLSTQQQKSASDLVAVSLREIAEGINHISSSIGQTNDSTKELNELALNLTQLINRFKLQEADGKRP